MKISNNLNYILFFFLFICLFDCLYNINLLIIFDKKSITERQKLRVAGSFAYRFGGFIHSPRTYIA
jgi:hypothetical protein